MQHEYLNVVIPEQDNFNVLLVSQTCNQKEPTGQKVFN